MEQSRYAAPDTDAYESAIIQVDKQFKKTGSALGIERSASYLSDRVKNYLSAISSSITPFDYEIGRYELDRYSSERAMKLGATAGLLIARYAHGDEGLLAEDIIDSTDRINASGELDYILRRKVIERQIRSAGDDGLEMVGPRVQGWLESQELRSIADKRTQPMYRIGAGVMVAFAADLLSRKQEHAQQQAMEILRSKFEDGYHDIDWDWSLRELLDD